MRFLIVAIWLIMPAAASAQIGMVEQTLARYDLDTLRPLGPQLTIGEPHTAPVLSPDKKRLAIGVSDTRARGLFIVGISTMQREHGVSLNGFAEAIVYPGVVAATSPGFGDRIAIIDPATGLIADRSAFRRFGCSPRGLTVGQRGVFVSALSPSGTVHVAIVEPNGRVRNLRVPMGRAVGSKCDGARAVRAGGQVLIVGPEAIVTLNPATRSVTRHAINSLGAVHDAEAVPDGLAVVGSHGLSVLSRSTWRVKWRDRNAAEVTFTRGTAIVIGHGMRGRRAGNGQVRWRRGGRAWLSEALRNRVFVDTASRRLVLDAQTGQVLARTGLNYLGVGFAGA